MKNPENKPLRIIKYREKYHDEYDKVFINMLGQLAIAESNLVKAGKDSALPHFIAIVKELEDRCGFKFEIIDEKI